MNPPTIVIDSPTEGQSFSFTGVPMEIDVSYTGTAGDNPILFYFIQIGRPSTYELAFCTVTDSSGGDVTWDIAAAADFTAGTHIVRVIAVDNQGFGGISADRTITITDDT